jgi:ubiquitin-conjugating enzyme E2 A
VQIFPDGSLCLDIIQDKWKPIYTVNSILTSVQVREAPRRRAGGNGPCQSGRLALTSSTPLSLSRPPSPAPQQSLLCDPNLDSPANVDAARLFKSNPKEYKKRVRAVAARSVEA